MGNTYVKIATVTVGGGGAATIDFSSIPSTYTDLELKISGRDTFASTGLSVFFTFNNNTGSVYSYKRLVGSGAAASSSSDSARANDFVGDQPGSTATASTFGNFQVYIPNYAGSTQKSYSADAVMENNVSSPVYAFLTAGLSTDTTAINRITLTCQTNFAEYSTATLYGISNS